MKKLCVLALTLLLLFACGCGKFFGSDEGFDLSRYWKISSDDIGMWKYSLTDLGGNTLIFDTSAKEPHFEALGSGVVKLLIQTGTGRSTAWTQYFDIEKGICSPVYHYTVADNAQKLAYVEVDSGVCRIVVCSIFDGALITEIDLDSASDAVDAVSGAELSADGKSITVEYLSGTDYKSETEVFHI